MHSDNRKLKCKETFHKSNVKFQYNFQYDFLQLSCGNRKCSNIYMFHVRLPQQIYVCVSNRQANIVSKVKLVALGSETQLSPLLDCSLYLTKIFS